MRRHNWHLNVPGFQCFRHGVERGGGVALLIKDNVTVELGEDILEGTSTDVLWVELKNKKGAITLMGLGPPNSQRKIEDQICWLITE